MIGKGFSTIFVIGMGGFLGAVCRYWFSLLPFQGVFPIATFLTNFLGAVIIGFVVELGGAVFPLPANVMYFVKTGFCGGFTTFSTFSLESVALLEQGQWKLSAVYCVGSVVICITGVYIGRFLAVRLF